MVVWLSATGGFVYLLAGVVSILVRGPNHLGFIVLAGGLAISMSPALQWGNGRPMIASIWLLGVLQLAGVAVAWTGYGPLSPVVPTFVLVPMTGLVLGGLRMGGAFSVIALAQVLLLLLASRLGYAFPLEPSGSRFILIYSLATMTSILVITGFLAAYETAWRRAAQKALTQAAQLIATSEAKSLFLANMSHELRTPLNVILGYTELILEDDAPQRADLERVHGAATHLLKLVDSLLNLEKIEAGHLQLHVESVDLAVLCGDVLVDVQPIAQQQATELSRQGLESCVVLADPLRLRQVLLNVLSNACKFTHQGRVTLALSMGSGEALIEVCDTGVGMSEEDLEVVFNPFQQGVAGQQQGTGLGLAISRKLCEAMGGTLTATSAVGEGTCVRIALLAAVE